MPQQNASNYSGVFGERLSVRPDKQQVELLLEFNQLPEELAKLAAPYGGFPDGWGTFGNGPSGQPPVA